MPELPEVETVCRSLNRHLPGQTIKRIQLRHTQLRNRLNENDMQQFCEGRQIIELRRRGKYIIAELNGERALLMHLGMTGSFRIVSQDTPPAKHEHVLFELGNGDSWRYEDARRFGILKCVQLPVAGATPEALEDLGPEPLEDGFYENYLFEKSRKRTKPLKNFIMDSKIVVGVGNIYASEALFRAGLSPLREAGSLKRKESALLFQTIRGVLAEAIEAGGTTISDFKTPDGNEGYFFRELAVYGRDQEACLSCASPIVRTVQAGRSTFYCKKCQR